MVWIFITHKLWICRDVSSQFIDRAIGGVITFQSNFLDAGSGVRAMVKPYRGGDGLVWMTGYVLIGIFVKQAVFYNQGMGFGFEVSEHVSGMIPDHRAIDKIRFHRGGTIAEEHRIGGRASNEKAIRAIGITSVDIAWSERLVNIGVVQGSRRSDISEYRARCRAVRQIRTYDVTSVEMRPVGVVTVACRRSVAAEPGSVGCYVSTASAILRKIVRYHAVIYRSLGDTTAIRRTGTGLMRIIAVNNAIADRY